MALSDLTNTGGDNTPLASGALVIGALAILVLLNRNLRTISASVAVHT